MSTVVGVHGMAQQQRGRNQLLSAWRPAFMDGVEIAGGREAVVPTLELAFYGDLFLSEDTQGTRAHTVEGRAKGALKGAAILDGDTDIDALDSVSVEELDFLDEAADEAIAQRPDLGEPMSGVPPVPALLRPLARKLTRHFDGEVVLQFVSALRQVKLYLDDDELAAQIRGRVLDAVVTETRILLAHSLGTVVAFDALALNSDLQIDTLITVGSPLSIRAVSTRLRLGWLPESRLPAFPPSVRRWVNIYDRGDPVAAAGEVSRLWHQAEDFPVNNEDEPHAIERYLGKRATGRAVLDALS